MFFFLLLFAFDGIFMTSFEFLHFIYKLCFFLELHYYFSFINFISLFQFVSFISLLFFSRPITRIILIKYLFKDVIYFVVFLFFLLTALREIKWNYLLSFVCDAIAQFKIGLLITHDIIMLFHFNTFFFSLNLDSFLLRNTLSERNNFRSK